MSGATRLVTPDPLLPGDVAPGDVFVFGSNLLGVHGGGAARAAFRDFGAAQGVAAGRTGRSYAFPTVTRPVGWTGWRRLTWEEMRPHRDALFEVAEWLGGRFWLTRVGCGLAGFAEAEMAAFFKGSPGNIVKPEGW